MVCSICGARWRGEPSVCPLDGGALQALPDPLLGRTIGGRYVITERIGAGGMGTVYRARHEIVGRDVAIKFLSPDLALDPTNRQRFLREAKAANRIDHEHIIDITDYGETDDGRVYLVMEFLDGEALSSLIARGPLPPYRAVDIALQMTGALARTHELDVIHRDIKPDNVYLLQRFGGGDFVKLLDFGLAKMKGEMRLTAKGAVFGTPEYMAPEQARGAPLTGKGDLYSLGCVLYEMLTGEPPFCGTTTELILKHIREVPAPPSSLQRGISPDLEALVMRLLEKDPGRRHADAYHVVEDLRAIAESLPRPSSAPPLSDLDLATTLRTDEGAAVAEVARRALSAAPDAWDERVARFRELARAAHPGAAPAWLTESIEELARCAADLASRRADLDRNADAARQNEEEVRNVRLRLGRAVDVLGRDESRAMRELEDLTSKLEDARAQLAAVEPHLRQAWAALPSLPTPLTMPAVEALRTTGQLAAGWLSASNTLDGHRRDLARRDQEREDLSFQVAQLKGRLGGLSAGADVHITELRERSRQLDEELQSLRDHMAALSEQVVKHFLSFPALSQAVREVSR